MSAAVCFSSLWLLRLGTSPTSLSRIGVPLCIGRGRPRLVHSWWSVTARYLSQRSFLSEDYARAQWIVSPKSSAGRLC